MSKNSSADSMSALQFVLSNDRNFDPEINQQLQKALATLIQNLPDKPNQIINLHQSLLFIGAYPANPKTLELSNHLMSNLVEHVFQTSKVDVNAYYNSGITGSVVCAQFGLLLNQYLLEENLETCELAGVDGDNSDLVSKLTHTLDSVEQELMPGKAGYFKNWIKQYLPGIKDKKSLLGFYINSSMQTSGSIAYKEGVFAGFQLFTQFSLDRSLQGLSTGRLSKANIHFHETGIQKKCSLEEMMILGKPLKIKLSPVEQQNLVRLARGAMASLLRETDTFTYAQSEETELFDMGKGISIALYYMVPEQKFALQSYVGYLLYKNGLPMAYGGCWITGFQAAFGVNVLPPYRGGESSLVVGQLLRLYSYRFHVTRFTVDPYQIGQGNSDGIQSGAFWFYYKLGFRPLQKDLAELAESEIQKMTIDKSYRTPSKILVKLADADIFWEVEAGVQVLNLVDVLNRISLHVSAKYNGNRLEALLAAGKKYRKIFGKKLSSDNFLNRMLITLDALGAFEKLSRADLEKVCRAYGKKGAEEALAHTELQKVRKYWVLLLG